MADVSGVEHVKLQLANQRLGDDNARLRKLIAKAETLGFNTAVCPWCSSNQLKRNGPGREPHAPDCPAFSAPGIAR